MRVKTPAIRRSSSTERISEPSCSRWPLRLGLFVVVERAFDPVQRTMEQIDGRPEEVFKIRFEAACRQGMQRSIEDVGDRTCDDTSVGERSRVGFVLGAIAAKLELGQNVGGWGGDRRVRRRSSGDVRRDRAERDETGRRQDVSVRPGEREAFGHMASGAHFGKVAIEIASSRRRSHPSSSRLRSAHSDSKFATEPLFPRSESVPRLLQNRRQFREVPQQDGRHIVVVDPIQAGLSVDRGRIVLRK